MGLRVGRLGRVDLALRLCTLGSAAWRGVGGGDLDSGSDGFFDHTGRNCDSRHAMSHRWQAPSRTISLSSPAEINSLLKAEKNDIGVPLKSQQEPNCQVS